MCSLKGQKETAEITLLNTVDTSRRVKTSPRNTPRYSYDSLGHCESSIKEVEIRVLISRTWRADPGKMTISKTKRETKTHILPTKINVFFSKVSSSDNNYSFRKVYHSTKTTALRSQFGSSI